MGHWIYVPPRRGRWEWQGDDLPADTTGWYEVGLAGYEADDIKWSMIAHYVVGGTRSVDSYTGPQTLCRWTSSFISYLKPETPIRCRRCEMLLEET